MTRSNQFIQISSSGTHNNPILDALDAEGWVWWYDYENRGWVRYPGTRYPEGRPTD
jgi:hypothetical protein